MEPGSSLPGGRQRGAPGLAEDRLAGGRIALPAEPRQVAEPLVEVIVATQGWKGVDPRIAGLARRAAQVAAGEAWLAGAEESGAINILLADDRTLRRLNTDHRGKAKPTNVLSFPGGVPGFLGDIALGFETVRREARRQQQRIAEHFAHLVAHGVLHLLGYDHLLAGEARRMEQAEARIMRRLGLPNPWRGVT